MLLSRAPTALCSKKIPLMASASLRAMSSSSSPSTPLLVSPTELNKLLSSDKPPVVLDASWHMPNLQPPRNALDEFRTKRILGAAFWHHDIIATKAAKDAPVQVPHMMPSGEIFADAASRLGIDRDSHVVVYDTVGVFSSPRAAFNFKAFGHERVSVLDGGLPRWEAEGHYIDTSVPQPINPHSAEEPKQTSYGPIMSELMYAKKPRVESYFIADIEEHMTEYPVPTLDESAVKNYEHMVDNSKLDLDQSEAEIVLDARPADRFHGKTPEPRAGLSSGHMPNSLSLPFSSLLSPKSSTTPSYQTLLSPDELEKRFIDALGSEELWQQVKRGDKGVVATCGSGMTAAVTWLALQVAGVKKAASVYDESWTGYAARETSEIVKS